MKSIPVSTADLAFVVVETAAAERDGKQSKTDDGTPLWVVRALVTSTDAKPEVLEVRVPAPSAPQFDTLAPVEFIDLVARPWSMEGRSGVSFSASAVRSTRGAKPGPNNKPEPAPVAGS